MSNIIPVQNYFAANLTYIQDACSHSKVNENVMDMIQILSNNVKLQECSPASIIGAVITASRLGVSLDPNIKHSYIIPYGKTAKLEVSFMGLIDVIYRSTGALVEAHMVHANDEFDYQQGSKPSVMHKPLVFGDRGALIGCYAISRMPSGEFSIEFLNMEEIENCRSVSKNPNGVWKKWFSEMAKKSAIRRLYKRLPKTTQSAMVASYDEKVETGQDVSEFYDIKGVEVPKEQTASQQLDELI